MMIRPSSILDHYGKINAAYLHAFGKSGTEQLLRELNPKEDERILEIGFGTGATLVTLKSRFPRVHLSGLETSPLMLEKTKSRLRFCGLGSDIDIRLMDNPDYTGFADHSVDNIYLESVLAIQEDETLEHLIAEIHRLLKPGGRLVFNETVWLPEITDKEISTINEMCKREFGIIQSSGKYKTAADWKTMLEVHGFEVLHYKRIDPGATAGQEKGRRFPEFLSRIFTIIGKIGGKLNKQLRTEDIRYKNIMKNLYEDKQYMEGTIFTARLR